MKNVTSEQVRELVREYLEVSPTFTGDVNEAMNLVDELADVDYKKLAEILREHSNSEGMILGSFNVALGDYLEEAGVFNLPGWEE